MRSCINPHCLYINAYVRLSALYHSPGMSPGGVSPCVCPINRVSIPSKQGLRVVPVNVALVLTSLVVINIFKCIFYFVLDRVLNLKKKICVFCPKQGEGIRHSAALLYPNNGQIPPDPYHSWICEKNDNVTSVLLCTKTLTTASRNNALSFTLKEKWST